MSEKYTFLSDNEPSEEQFAELMRGVLADVKQRALIADERFNYVQMMQIQEANNWWLEKKKSYEQK